MSTWLLTYAVHSTVLLAAAWLVLRFSTASPAARSVVWKAAMLGGLVTATIQASFDIRPAGTIVLGAVVSESGANPQEALSQASPASRPALVDGAEPPAFQQEATWQTPANEPAVQPAAVPVATVLTVGWLVLALLLVMWYAGRHLVLVGRLGDRRAVTDPDWTGLLALLHNQAGFRRQVQLTASQAITSPVALGSSEICLPLAALDELEPAQRRAMLAHELAHLMRRDPQWLVLACVIERLFFFQPLNRLARRGIQESAEYLADEWAARRSGGVPLARCLVKVAEWLEASPLGVPVAGMAEQRSQLSARVARLLERGDAPPSRGRVAVACSVAGLVATALFAPGVAGLTHSGVKEPGAAPGASLVAAAGDTAVVRALIARLRDENAEVRQAAADALGRIGDPLAIPALVASLDDPEAEVRRSALDALSQFERGVPAAPIRALLTFGDAEVRARAASMLGQMRDRSSVGAIGRLVQDSDADVRREAIHALAEIRDPAGTPAVAAALQDADADVRRHAVEAMNELGGTIPDATLTGLLQDRSADVRQEAVMHASERRVVSMAPQLIRMLDDLSPDVREEAAEALTELRTAESHAALRRALEHSDPDVRRIAVEYFGEQKEDQ
jgi:HEAT repeat protein/beta-lactamase regulating signal transducer with metallopeptidase domain